MHPNLMDILACPACSGDLSWEILEEHGSIERGWARCQDCETAYPVYQGIGVFLLQPAPEEHWEAETQTLLQAVHAQPGAEARLLSSPLDSLSPVDAYYRALLLESQGDLAQARIVYETAKLQIYSPETLICHESQVHYLVESLRSVEGPVLVLSSGRADLTENLRRSLRQPLIIAGASPGLLARLRRWLAFLRLDADLSLLAFDPRQSPFKPGSIPLAATDMELANQQAPALLLKELRRIASRLAAVHAFYLPEDEPNAAAIERLGLKSTLYWESLQPLFTAAGWDSHRENVCRGRARAAPRGGLISGVGIDALPVEETWLEWCTLVAQPLHLL